MKQKPASYEKYYVLNQALLKKLVNNNRIYKNDSSPLEKELLKVLKNKKIGPSTRWIMYRDILGKYGKSYDVKLPTRPPTSKGQSNDATMRNFDKTPAVEIPEPIGKKPRRRQKEIEIQTEQPPTTQEEGVQTQIIPSKFYEDVYEREPTPEDDTVQPLEDERLEFTDHALEEFLRQAAAEDSGVDAKRLRRRPNLNDSEYAVYDDPETGAVTHVDIQKARDELYQNEPMPETISNKIFSPSKTHQLRTRTILKKDKYINRFGKWSSL